MFDPWASGRDWMLYPPYSIIYADPPWWYSSRSVNRRTKFGGGARAHYDVMRDEEVIGMADWVQSLAAENCALCLWATCPRLDIAIKVLKAWGFRYCSRRQFPLH